MKSVISDLADAMKVGGEYVFEKLVKQQQVKSIIKLIQCLLLWVTSIFFTKLALSRMNRFKLEYNEEIKNNISHSNRIHSSRPDFFEDDYGLTSTFILVGIIGLVVALIATVAMASPVFTGFINPEYGAIDYITNLIK